MGMGEGSRVTGDGRLCKRMGLNTALDALRSVAHGGLKAGERVFRICGGCLAQ